MTKKRNRERSNDASATEVADPTTTIEPASATEPSTPPPAEQQAPQVVNPLNIQPPSGMPPEEQEKFMRAMKKMAQQVGAQPGPAQPGPAQPPPATAQAAAQQPAQTPEQVQQVAMQELQRLALPWLHLLHQKRAIQDPLTIQISKDISHCAAQLVRYISDELQRSGHAQIAIQAYNPQIFPQLALAVLNETFGLYVYTVDAHSGPDYWLQYLNNNVIHDLRERVNALAPARPGVKTRENDGRLPGVQKIQGTR